MVLNGLRSEDEEKWRLLSGLVSFLVVTSEVAYFLTSALIISVLYFFAELQKAILKEKKL